jgi:hypothetical protein
MMLSILALTIMITAAVTAYYLYQPNAARVSKFRQWMRNPDSQSQLQNRPGLTTRG